MISMQVCTVQDVPRGHNISYRETLRLIITNLWSTVMVAHLLILEWIMLASWPEVKNATAEYQKYMVEILHEERTLNSKDKKGESLECIFESFRCGEGGGRVE